MVEKIEITWIILNSKISIIFIEIYVYLQINYLKEKEKKSSHNIMKIQVRNELCKIVRPANYVTFYFSTNFERGYYVYLQNIKRIPKIMHFS